MYFPPFLLFFFTVDKIDEQEQNQALEQEKKPNLKEEKLVRNRG